MKVIPKKKVVAKKCDNRDVNFAHTLINHLKGVLMEEFDFIVDTTPEVTFLMDDYGMILNTIRFEADDVDAAIMVDEEYVTLLLDNTQHCTLYQHDDFAELMSIDETDLYEMDAVTKERLEDVRKLWFSMD